MSAHDTNECLTCKHVGVGYCDSHRSVAAAPKAGDMETSPNVFGIACTVAWTELVQALRADGHDVKDKSGPTTRKWIEGIVRDTFAAPTPPASQEAPKAEPVFYAMPRLIENCHAIASVQCRHSVVLSTEPDDLYSVPLYAAPTPPASQGDAAPAGDAAQLRAFADRIDLMLNSTGGQVSATAWRLMAHEMRRRALAAAPAPAVREAVDAEDAARYRWLRAAENELHPAWDDLIKTGVSDTEFDEIVDAARTKEST